MSESLLRTDRGTDISCLRTALDPLPVGVILFDPEGTPLLANRAARDLLGDHTAFGLDEWISSGCFLRPDGTPAREADLPPCLTRLDGRAHVEVELCFRRWRERTVPLLVSSRSVLDPDGNILQISCSLTPIAEHTRRRESERLRARFDAIDTLMAGVTGPLNDALTAIAGYCELAEDRLDDGDPMAGILAGVREAGERATVLTGRLVSHAQREVPVTRVLLLDAWLSTHAPALHAMLGDHIVLELAPSAPGVRVQADPRLLIQVLAELLANARAVTPAGGRVRITTAPSLDEIPGGAGFADPKAEETAVLTVTDEGGGTGDSVLRRMFEPFFTTRDGALGLGLPTVERLVRSQGGRLGVENRRGEGMSFHVHVPLCSGLVEDEVGRVDVEQRIGNRSLSVLVVEDDAVVRDLVRTVLHGQGLHVLEARDADHANRVLDENPGLEPDLLVSDVVLPGQGGVAMASDLRQRFPELRVLLMSGCGNRTLLWRALEDTARTAFLPKPFAPHALLDGVRELLVVPDVVGDVEGFPLTPRRWRRAGRRAP